MQTSSGVTSLALIVAVSIGAAACQNRTAPSEPAPADLSPTATVKDLMLSLIDTSADTVWLSVTTVVSEKGTVETVPRSDEDWAKVRYGALALAEGANLLMMPERRVARPGEKSETPGVELEPEEMDALIAKDRAAWNMRATALRDVAREALKAIDSKDAETLFAVGERIENACEGCHKQYWYPNEVVPEFELKSQ